jgi:elongator complex protein 1
VAQKSQMDPKEYLPFLNKLRQLPTYYQQYSVDLHLGKVTSALENLW